MQLTSLQATYSKQMLEEKQKSGIKTAIIQSLKGNIITISTIEKYKLLIKRYY